MIKWRWDQGRLQYFRFENISAIAKTLASLDGTHLNVKGGDPLRSALSHGTKLPFLPANYTVWRNYARVFGCSLLAGRISNRLQISDICRSFAESSEYDDNPDRYFLNLFQKFSYPHPAFSDYNSGTKPIYPFCAIIKLLISKLVSGNSSSLTVDEICRLLISNQIDGTENLTHYGRIIPQSYQPSDDEIRQLREMLIFASQVSFLKWFNSKLILDVSLIDSTATNDLVSLASPAVRPKLDLPEEDFLAMSNAGEMSPNLSFIDRESPNDITFTEGQKRRVTHLRTERSPQLRIAFFNSMAKPYLCDMCRCNPKERYVWTENILEIHHLLPLSATVAIQTDGTTLADVVPICPNCHKSTHEYYRGWLHDNKITDFPDKTTAVMVYNEAKNAFTL